MVDDGASAPDVPPELSETAAPGNTDFRSVRDVLIEIEMSAYSPRGTRVYLKISDPRVGQLFLGRVDSESTIKVDLSVLRASDEIVYELYDETGWQIDGSIALQ
jgi:hypothetical protein